MCGFNVAIVAKRIRISRRGVGHMINARDKRRIRTFTSPKCFMRSNVVVATPGRRLDAIAGDGETDDEWDETFVAHDDVTGAVSKTNRRQQPRQELRIPRKVAASPYTVRGWRPMRSMKILLAAAVPLTGLVGSSACSDVGELRDLRVLSASISTQYGTAASINLSNGARLTVTFQNSKYSELPDSSREDFARRVAQYAFAQYARRDSLTEIRVGFRSVRGAGGLSVSHSEVPYAWPRAELKAAADSAAAGRAP